MNVPILNPVHFASKVTGAVTEVALAETIGSMGVWPEAVLMSRMRYFVAR